MNEQLLTIREVARICRVHEVTIRREIARGHLKAVRIGRQLRVRSEDAESFAEADAGRIDHDYLPFTLDDPFWSLVGSVDAPELAGLSDDKYAYLTEP